MTVVMGRIGATSGHESTREEEVWRRLKPLRQCGVKEVRQCGGDVHRLVIATEENSRGGHHAHYTSMTVRQRRR
jgi:hypothetical protein